MMEALFSLWLWFSGLMALETPPPFVQSPIITFSHASIIDRLVCPIASVLPWPGKVKMDVDYQKQKADLQLELPKLQKLWDIKGPRLLKKAAELLNTSYGYRLDETGLFLCSNIPSWAKPRIISVWQYMPSTPEKLRWKELEFVDVIFHEHLHMLVNRQLGWKLKSKILDKYASEALFAKIHIHLYALQKQTYLELGLDSEWQQIVARSKTFTPSYQRAVEIVEQEGAEALVQEMKI